MTIQLGIFCLIIALACCAAICVVLFKKTRQQAIELKKLSASEQEYRKFVESSPNKIIRYDTDCRRTYVSFSSSHYLNVDADFLLGKTPTEFPGGGSAIAFERHLREVIDKKINKTVNFEWQAMYGKKRVLRFELIPEFCSGGNVLSVLGVAQDITEVVDSQQRIGQLTSYDQLTNLPNRIFFTHHLSDLLATRQQPFAVMHIDLDHFKEMNDLLGYVLANQLILDIAGRLRAIIQQNALLARLDGDAFAIVLPKIKHHQTAMHLAKKITAMFDEPFNVAAKEVFITGSIGVAFSPDDSSNPEVLLNYADAAMRHAKKMGRNNFQRYHPELTKKSIMRSRLDTSLRKAVVNHELELYYQPQIILATGEIVGAEALLRWKHPELGMVAPDRFIPLAEETGQIIEIGNWVLLSAFKAAAKYNRHRLIPIKISINLSSRQFIRNDLSGIVKELLLVADCKAEWIKLEITESLLLDQSEHVLQILMELSDMGIELSIDDFGTGYSALGYLTRYPISQIKIDRSFIADTPIDLEKCELVKVFIQIATILHLDLVAEGVETSEQVAFLNHAGCKAAQGYFYYKPMPEADLTAILDAALIS